MIHVNFLPLNVTHFPDGTSQVWKLDPSLLSQDAVTVAWDFDDEAEVMHLAQLKTLLDHHGVEANLHIAYLPYGRQDKPVSNDATFALQTFADVLNDMAFNSVTIYDPHSSKAERLIDRSESTFFRLATAQAYRDTESNALCLPDDGAAKKYRKQHRDWIHRDGVASVTGAKVRDAATGDITKYEFTGDVQDKRVFIVDDICDGGATFILLAKALREAGATYITLFVSHGLFTRGTACLFAAGIDEIWTPKGKEPFHALVHLGARLEFIARTVHEANRSFCIAAGVTRYPHWQDAHPNQRDLYRDVLTALLALPDAAITAERVHVEWVQGMLTAGWQLGAVLDVENKQHPALVPFSQLSELERAKDRLVVNVMRVARDACRDLEVSTTKKEEQENAVL